MQDSSLTSILMLGSLTALVNQSLRLVEGSDEQLATVTGAVIRFRLERPALVLYLMIHEDGVEFLEHYEGKVDVRIRAPMGALLQYLLLPNAETKEDIRIQGDQALLSRLSDLLDFGSFWAVARGWLDHYVRFGDLLGLLGKEDPSWLANLRELPDQFQAMARDLAHQRLMLEDVLAEVRGLRRQISSQRRWDLLSIVVGLLLIFAAFATQSGNLPNLWLHQTVLLASAGAALLLSRLFSPS